MDELLEPCNEDLTLTRNATELSRYSESIVKTFIAKRATRAYVHYERSEYDIQTLYKGLYNVCNKNAYRKTVEVRKRDGKIVLVRIDL